MVCHEFKGGIGTSSRVLDAEHGGFTVAALVQANYGKRAWLRVDGVPVGEAIGTDVIPSPYDQGDAVDASGSTIWTVTSTIFVRGEGGWGGDRGPSTAVELPDREPTATTSYRVTPQQALLYRLCGDRNPLHADPEFAEKAGFRAAAITYQRELRTRR
jgi:hypothetical protein